MTKGVDCIGNTYTITEMGANSTFYITPTSNWVDTLHTQLCDEFAYRITELEEDNIDPNEYGDWDSTIDVANFLDELQSSDDIQLLADAFTLSTVWGWIKVFDTNTGELIFEAYGNGL